MRISIFLFLLLLSNMLEAADLKQEAFLSDWLSSCNSQSVNSPKVCGLERNLFYDKTMSKRMISIGFRTVASEPIVMTIISPLGSLISEGVEVDIKGLEGKKLPFILCDQRGCLSQMQLTNEMLVSLNKQKTLMMKYQLVNANKAIVNFDLTGFDVSFAKIKQ